MVTVCILLTIGWAIATGMILATVEADHWGWIFLLIFVSLLMVIILLAERLQEWIWKTKKGVDK